MKDPGTELALAGPETTALYRQATDVASLCKEIVLKKSIKIGGRKYVPVEAWMTIATAHGCMASVKSVEVIPGVGVKAVAEVKRMSDGAVLSSAEGFVGEDEVTWFGGTVTRLIQGSEREVKVEKRPNYAIRAMAQTRAVSRVCRTSFAHVVVLMDAGLETVPAEEMGDPEEPAVTQEEQDRSDKRQAEGTSDQPGSTEGKKEGKKEISIPREGDPKLVEQFRNNKWEKVVIHFGTYKDRALGELESATLRGWLNWIPKPYGNKPISQDDILLRAALDAAGEEAFNN